MGDSERMSQTRVTIVVAEGVPTRRGLLGYVLRGEGYDVVGEAQTTAELGRDLAIHDPDVVVIDDGIGATAVTMTRQMAPAAKIILVWPEAVAPIGSDASVPPSAALRDLGPTVERLTGVISATGRRATALGITGRPTIHDLLGPQRPTTPEPGVGAPAVIFPARLEPPAAAIVPAAQTGRPVRKGLLTMAELEAARAAAPPQPVSEPLARPDRPGGPPPALVTPVIHPTARVEAAPPRAGSPPVEDPTPPTHDTDTPQPREAWAAVEGGAARDRRLGTIALGGAAAAGALVLALALGGSHGPFHEEGHAPTVPPTLTTPAPRPTGSEPLVTASGRPPAVEGGITPGSGTGSAHAPGDGVDGALGGGILGGDVPHGHAASGGTGHGAAPDRSGTLSPDTESPAAAEHAALSDRLAPHGAGLSARIPPHER